MSEIRDALYWIPKCKALEAENARLREALEKIKVLSESYRGHANQSIAHVAKKALEEVDG